MIDIHQTDQKEYMYSDVTPIIPDINLEQLKHIEKKLIAYISGNYKIGLNREELEQFLDWITYINAICQSKRM